MNIDQVIISQYIDGLSMTKISSTLNITTRYVKKILVGNNIPILKKGDNLKKYTKYSCNESFFEKIDTEAKAYLLGFIFADGYLIEKKQTFGLKIAQQDKYILEVLKNSIECTNPIIDVIRNDGQDQCRLCIFNHVFIENLLKCGVKYQKSRNCDFPTCIPDDLLHHFMRGYFDGDGCIHIFLTKPNNLLKGCFSVIGTKSFIQTYQEKLNKHCNITPLFSIKETSAYYVITKKGNNNLCYMREFLYKDATIFLQRKYDKFFKIQTYRKKR